ncbi:hypothetical protein VB618_04950 [Microvirga sp. CF3062]|uniref:hypothetical protein n=1 Tax=Microvirga sp. CF3062 TaxID=3110182 RepID=UPI002E78E8B3|nr:hypothetical protein [Microvirga sp. CF3062]MEE1655537.1 hypothetical protein [Microvirga sp. CF3062]
MRSVKSWRARIVQAATLVLLSGAVSAQAANGPLDRPVRSEPVQVRFDPMIRQTSVTGVVPSGLCFSFSLPEEWRLTAEGVKAARSDVEIGIGLRSAGELRDMPQPDLASRDAAFLQKDYEELLGRPAQSVSLSSHGKATHWSATWIDANLPSASQSMTVETLIVPLSGEWVLELSLSGVDTRASHDALAQRLLTRLQVQGRAACQG